MRIANVDNRAKLLVGERLVDIADASDGRLPSDPIETIQCLEQLSTYPGLTSADGPRVSETNLGPPIPRPSKILAAAGNYRDHIEEDGISAVPGEPNLFAKLPSALAGPFDPIEIPPGRTHIDWEAELVVVIGRLARNILADDAWSYVAGVTCGQDISDRDEQRRAFQQFTMAKSFDTYAPIGPYLVTLDELEDRNDIPIRCFLNGAEMQSGSTRNLIFSIPDLISWASHVATLEPGDLFFTGTPGGVGAFREPPRWLRHGETLRTVIPGVGAMENRVIALPV